jgi:hypothetical protein
MVVVLNGYWSTYEYNEKRKKKDIGVKRLATGGFVVEEPTKKIPT